MVQNIHEQPFPFIEVVDLKDNLVTLMCKQTLPVGSRISFEIEKKGLKYAGKIIEITKSGSEIFRVKIRLHNFSKAHREELEKRRAAKDN